MAARATVGSFADGIRLPIRCYLIVAPANLTHIHPTILAAHPFIHWNRRLVHLLAAPRPLPPPSPPLPRRAVLHNLRYDDTVMQLHNASGAGTNASLYLTGSDAQAARLAAGGACTTISFRTGAACGAVLYGVWEWSSSGHVPALTVSMHPCIRCLLLAQPAAHTSALGRLQGALACEEACHLGAVPRRVAGRLFTQARTYPAASLARPPPLRRHHASMCTLSGVPSAWLKCRRCAGKPTCLCAAGVGGRMGRQLRTRRRATRSLRLTVGPLQPSS